MKINKSIKSVGTTGDKQRRDKKRYKSQKENPEDFESILSRRLADIEDREKNKNIEREEIYLTMDQVRDMIRESIVVELKDTYKNYN